MKLMTRTTMGGAVDADANIPKIPSVQISDESEIGGEVCGSLDEWLHPLPSSRDLEIPLHMQPIYEKHKKLYAAEVQNTLTSFGQVLQSMFCKRMALILVEANSTATSSKEHSFEDVTFHAPAGNAAAADHTSVAPHSRVAPQTSAAPHTSAAAQQAEVDKEMAAGPDTNQTRANGDIGFGGWSGVLFVGAVVFA